VFQRVWKPSPLTSSVKFNSLDKMFISRFFLKFFNITTCKGSKPRDYSPARPGPDRLLKLSNGVSGFMKYGQKFRGQHINFYSQVIHSHILSFKIKVSFGQTVCSPVSPVRIRMTLSPVLTKILPVLALLKTESTTGTT
jgi:hypothetical protein